MNYDVILIRYGELSLKSTYVRKQFESTLIYNIQRALNQENISNSIAKERGRIYLSTKEIEKSCSVLQRIFGVVSCSPAIQITTDLDIISKHSIKILKDILRKQKSFALRVTRVGNHPFTSQDVAVHIGNAIVNETHAPVDLTNPDIELFIEIRQNKTFLFMEKYSGAGGLPMGTQGKILALITIPSSLLAVWFLMRRGCTICLATTSHTNDDIVKSFLSQWYAQEDIRVVDPSSPNYFNNLCAIALDNDCNAIVTGHTLDKSASALSEMKQLKKQCNLPILTPLIALSEDEIKKNCQTRGILL
jgi:adenylyl- and sulfurtransferase ThiI